MIRTRLLAFAYPGAAPLRFPDADVPQGGTLLLQGRSGTGKSTWLSLVAALREAADGELVVAGQDVRALPGLQRDRWRGRHVGFLPQKLHLSEALTVEGNLDLAFFAAGLPHDRKRIAQALQALGIAALAHRRPSQLSGGQAQRAALARAVLLSPQLILADEPTASLDDEAAASALSLLRDAAQRCGATLVIATHDRRVREDLADAQQLRLDEEQAVA
ncbi:ATP-binding cassette domain-containing protein [Ramlibacter sp. Leaf400]|uniref:ATP-binding cassette domain-containing protein n=1 Tax=Ramlibacter sp. Leaf400 TaxID=1736365 RepID=UPI000700184A|nr:ATP-binding cassette domain-containing protein [Ramlibacter sp. Leaf400]KQT13528.1 ABC transporter [Ramlibacter sp. Leaf400]